jgi:hypothetical protein
VTTVREQAQRAALAAVRAALPDLTVLRNAPEPAEVDEPLLVLTDPQERVEAEERTLGCWWFSFSDPIDVSLYVQSRFVEERDTFVDEIVERIEAGLALDRTLGGVVDHCELGPPGKTLDHQLGAAAVTVAAMTLTLRYLSAASSG